MYSLQDMLPSSYFETLTIRTAELKHCATKIAGKYLQFVVTSFWFFHSVSIFQ